MKISFSRHEVSLILLTAKITFKEQTGQTRFLCIKNCIIAIVFKLRLGEDSLTPTFNNSAIFAEVLLQGLLGGLRVQPSDEKLSWSVCLCHDDAEELSAYNGTNCRYKN